MKGHDLASMFFLALVTPLLLYNKRSHRATDLLSLRANIKKNTNTQNTVDLNAWPSEIHTEDTLQIIPSQIAATRFTLRPVCT